MKYISRKALILIILSHIIFYGLSSSKVFANDNQYSNQLLKLNVEKANDNNEVKVTVFSSKPYKLKLNPVKRNDNEYEIFLPNTYHSITSKQDISAINDKVQDVDVKLIPNVDSKANNGYTKISFKTANGNVKFDINNKVVKHDQSFDRELLSLIYQNKGQNSFLNSRISHLNKHIEKKSVKIASIKTKSMVEPSPIIKAVNQKVQPKKEIKYKPVLIQTGAQSAVILKKPVTSTVNTDETLTNKVALGNKKVNEVNAKEHSSNKSLLNVLLLITCLMVPSLGLIFLLLIKARWQRPINLNFEKYCEEQNLNKFEHYSEVPIQELSNIEIENTLEIIEGVEISENKGIYLVQLQDDKALIGIDGSNIHLLNKFDDMNYSKFTVRKADRVGKYKDMFYVQLDQWRGLVSSTLNNMNLEMVF